MTSPALITWITEGISGKPFHLARHRMRPHALIGSHRHDFDECFWLEKGDGWHHTAAGDSALRVGDVVCVRAADVHGFTAGAHGFSLVNLSFPRAVGARLASCSSVPWPWRAGGELAQRSMSPTAVARLQVWTSELMQPGSSLAELDAFLFDLVRLLTRSDHTAMPPRLLTACTAFVEVRHLAGGTVALARLAGCGPAHLNRLCRRWHACTASELVARLRLDWAARELRLSEKSITTIAETCGMPHLGHFYRRFHGRFGTTPKAWRDAAWGLFSPG